MTKIEEVARAIYEKRNGHGCKAWGHQPNSHKAPYLSDARAAIETMRTPTEAMVDAYVRDGHGKTIGEVAQNGWFAMIDAALSEGEDRG